jgi:hypothetical protein
MPKGSFTAADGGFVVAMTWPHEALDLDFDGRIEDACVICALTEGSGRGAGRNPALTMVSSAN